MKIKKATEKDLNEIINIYNKARDFMKESGNGGQWQNGYPQKELIENDIKNGTLYICLDQNKIVGVFCYFVGIEPTYKKIYGGEWLNNEPYGVVHRIAVGEHHKGVASFCIQWCINNAHNIKIDTHENNIPMQKTILKNGFTFCGTIKKEDGTSRLAYQIIK